MGRERRRNIYAVLALFIVLISSLSGLFKFRFELGFPPVPQKILPKKIGMVEIEGVILDPEPYLKSIWELEKDLRVAAIVVRVDSPGGSVSASEEIYRELKRISEKKKIVVSMGSIATSGAYLISLAAHKILALPGTTTGSIGVILEYFNLSELLKTLKVEAITIKSGKMKDMGSPFRPPTDEEREFFEKFLEENHKRFKELVSKERRIPLDEVEKIADGRIFTGEMAKELKLIDEIGGVKDAIREAAHLANIPEDSEIVQPRKKKIPFQWLFDLFSFKVLYR